MSGNPRRFYEPLMVMRLDRQAEKIEVSADWPVESIIALCEPVFSRDSDEREVSRAINAITELLGDLLRDKTEEIRGALSDMIDAHHKRTALSGKCTCHACLSAVKVLGSDN